MGIGVSVKNHQSKKVYAIAIYGLSIFLLILNTYSCNKKNISIKIESKISEFECPVFPGAYNVSVSTQNPPGTKAFSYILKMEYPAQQVIDFYDNKFKPPEWLPFTEDGFGDRKWFGYIDGTLPGEPKVNRFIASWVDPKKEVRLILALVYLSTDEKNELGVTCQIYPFFDLRSVEKRN